MMTRFLCFIGLHYCPTKQFKFYQPKAYNGNAWLYGSCRFMRLKKSRSYCIYCGRKGYLR